MLVSGMLLFSLLFVWVIPVHAQDVVYGNGIPAGSVVDQDIILSGTEIVIDGTVNGDVLALGQLVTVNGTINGSLYSGAEILMVGGKINGSVYSAGGTLRLKPEAKLDRSVFFAGGLLDFQSGSCHNPRSIQSGTGCPVQWDDHPGNTGDYWAFGIIQSISQSDRTSDAGDQSADNFTGAEHSTNIQPDDGFTVTACRFSNLAGNRQIIIWRVSSRKILHRLQRHLSTG